MAQFSSSVFAQLFCIIAELTFDNTGDDRLVLVYWILSKDHMKLIVVMIPVLSVVVMLHKWR